MKRFIGLAVCIALLSFGCSAFASVAVKNEFEEVVPPAYVGEATALNIKGQEVSFDGSTVTILANGHKDGVTLCVSDKTQCSNLTSGFLAYGVIRLNDIGALGEFGGTDARYVALANGTAGQMLTITIVTDSGGTLYITDDKISASVFTMTNTGWDDLAFDSALDSVTLLYVDDVYGWILIGQNSVTVT